MSIQRLIHHEDTKRFLELERSSCLRGFVVHFSGLVVAAVVGLVVVSLAFSSIFTFLPSLKPGRTLYGPVMIFWPSFRPEVICVCVMSLAPMLTGVMAALSPSRRKTTVASVLFLSISGLFLTDAGRSSTGRPITACVGTLITFLCALVSMS